jgi:hypothetical protein
MIWKCVLITGNTYKLDNVTKSEYNLETMQQLQISRIFMCMRKKCEWEYEKEGEHSGVNLKYKFKNKSNKGTLSGDPSQFWDLYNLLLFYLNELSHLIPHTEKQQHKGIVELVFFNLRNWNYTNYF